MANLNQPPAPDTSSETGNPNDFDVAPVTPPDVSRGHRRNRTRFLAAFLFGLLAVLAASAGAMAAFAQSFDGRILPGVRGAGVDLSGLTHDEASHALASASAALAKGTLTVSLPGGESIELSYADLGRRLDVDAMVAEAMSRGRDGALAEQVAGGVRTAIGGTDIEKRVVFDGAVLAAAIDALAERAHAAPQDAGVGINGDAFVLRPAADGRAAAREFAVSAATALLADPSAATGTAVELRIDTVPPAISTAAAERAMADAELMTRDILLATGSSRAVIPASAVFDWLSFRPAPDGRLEVVADGLHVQATLGELAPAFELAVVDATYTLSANGKVGVKPAREGRALDPSTTTARVMDLLADRAAGLAVNQVLPAIVRVNPALSTAEAEATAPKMAVISGWTTYFPIGIKNGQGANIWIPAADLDGTVLLPGEWFDFWKEIGPVTRERGYKDGGAIINGKTEPQGALAGGICSTSTTMFNAALRAGLEMGARRNHYYYIDRYPLGLDATVFQSSSGSTQTMSFRNDTPYPIFINAKRWAVGSKGYVRFELLSIPTGREVAFSAPTVKNVKPAEDTTQYTDTLPYGTKERVEYAVEGKDVWVTRTVTDAGGTIVHEETYYSHYARITGLTLVGTKGAPAPSPSPTPTP